MNERIKELAEQSGCKVMDGEWYIPSATGLEKIVYTKGLGLEKFAELLIQKCVDISDDYVKDCTCEEHIDCKHPRSAIGRKIREYFNA